MIEKVFLENDNQVSEGDLNDSEYISRDKYRTIEESVEEVAIEELKEFNLIENYFEVSENIYPTVIRTPSFFYVIDGMEKVEKAKKNNLESIKCKIFEIGYNSDTEVAIRKVASRIRPMSGRCLYGEKIRNINILCKQLHATMENPIVYYNGGVRRGLEYSNNKEEDVLTVLANRFGRSRKTIRTWYSYGENLSEEALNVIIQSKVNRDFFEKARRNKSNLHKQLKHLRESEDLIKSKLSELMLNMLEEYKETGGKIKNRLDNEYIETDANDNENDNTKNFCRLFTPSDLKYGSSNNNSETNIDDFENSFHDENIDSTWERKCDCAKERGFELGTELIIICQKDDINEDELIISIEDLIKELSIILTKIKTIKNEETRIGNSIVF